MRCVGKLLDGMFSQQNKGLEEIRHRLSQLGYRSSPNRDIGQRVRYDGAILVMKTVLTKFTMIGATCVLLAGCDSFWPALEPTNPGYGGAGGTTFQSNTTSGAAVGGPIPASSVDSRVAASAASYGSTTVVGERINEMESDLSRLTSAVGGLRGQFVEIRTNSSSNAQAYHVNKADITSRLQLGTTPGNPVLVGRWNAAQAALQQVEQTIPALSSLQGQAADQAAFGKFLLSTVQATYGLSGAVDEDHARLRGVEDSVFQSLVDLDRMITDVTQEINRHNLYVSNERQNMTTLSLGIKNGELYGTNLASRSFTLVEAAAASAAASGPGILPGAEPLVIIKFDRENVPYQQALYNAVSQALTVKPAAVFDLVAVSPMSGNAAQIALNDAAARRNAEDVLRTMTTMGVQPGRVNMLANSQAVAINEVHLYVR